MIETTPKNPLDQMNFGRRLSSQTSNTNGAFTRNIGGFPSSQSSQTLNNKTVEAQIQNQAKEDAQKVSNKLEINEEEMRELEEMKIAVMMSQSVGNQPPKQVPNGKSHSDSQISAIQFQGVKKAVQNSQVPPKQIPKLQKTFSDSNINKFVCQMNVPEPSLFREISSKNMQDLMPFNDTNKETQHLVSQKELNVSDAEKKEENVPKDITHQNKEEKSSEMNTSPKVPPKTLPALYRAETPPSQPKMPIKQQNTPAKKIETPKFPLKQFPAVKNVLTQEKNPSKAVASQNHFLGSQKPNNNNFSQQDKGLTQLKRENETFKNKISNLEGQLTTVRKDLMGKDEKVKQLVKQQKDLEEKYIRLQNEGRLKQTQENNKPQENELVILCDEKKVGNKSEEAPTQFVVNKKRLMEEGEESRNSKRSKNEVRDSLFSLEILEKHRLKSKLLFDLFKCQSLHVLSEGVLQVKEETIFVGNTHKQKLKELSGSLLSLLSKFYEDTKADVMPEIISQLVLILEFTKVCFYNFLCTSKLKHCISSFSQMKSRSSLNIH